MGKFIFLFHHCKGNLFRQMIANDLKKKVSSDHLKVVEKEEYKLLLLGTGESGKSVLPTTLLTFLDNFPTITTNKQQ
jgi:GTPase SAR1 family protein